MSLLSAIVFDCDGVLVDSEEIADDAWRSALARHGCFMDAADAAFSKGRTDHDLYRHLSMRCTMPPWEEFQQVLRTETERRYRDELRPFLDAAATVQALAFEAVPIAVASSSTRWKLDLALELAGLARYFEHTVAGDEVDRGKPAPDLYLAAAAMLGLPAASCLAVEDSRAGADSAASAGMRVVVVQRPNAPLVPGFAAVSELDPEAMKIWLGLG